jgi:hypothetical protein
MTTEALNTRPYRLRMTARHVIYVESGSNLFRDFAAGQVISDPDTINLLEAAGAPVERISNEEGKGK